MNKCSKCNVFVHESEPLCPLCYEEMPETKPSVVEYPSYNQISKVSSPLRNIPHFAGITATIICIFINIFTHDKGEIIWVVPTGASVLFALGIYMLARSQFHRFGEKILYGYVMFAVFIIVIDFSTKMLFWSTDFVFPFATLVILIYFTYLSLRSKSTFSEYFGYLITITLISLSSILFYMLDLYNYTWGSFITILSCVIIVLALYLFADKSLKEEVKKRFHSK